MGSIKYGSYPLGLSLDKVRGISNCLSIREQNFDILNSIVSIGMCHDGVSYTETSLSISERGAHKIHHIVMGQDHSVIIASILLENIMSHFISSFKIRVFYIIIVVFFILIFILSNYSSNSITNRLLLKWSHRRNNSLDSFRVHYFVIIIIGVFKIFIFIVFIFILSNDSSNRTSNCLLLKWSHRRNNSLDGFRTHHFIIRVFEIFVILILFIVLIFVVIIFILFIIFILVIRMIQKNIRVI